MDVRLLMLDERVSKWLNGLSEKQLGRWITAVLLLVLIVLIYAYSTVTGLSS
jgi:hypothetical protein